MKVMKKVNLFKCFNHLGHFIIIIKNKSECFDNFFNDLKNDKVNCFKENIKLFSYKIFFYEDEIEINKKIQINFDIEKADGDSCIKRLIENRGFYEVISSEKKIDFFKSYVIIRPDFVISEMN